MGKSGVVIGLILIVVAFFVGAIIFFAVGIGQPCNVERSTIYKVVEDSTLVVLEDQSGKRLLYDMKGLGKIPKSFKVDQNKKITHFP